MKYTVKCSFIVLLAMAINLSLTNCTSSKTEQESVNEIVASNDFYQINDRIDKAIENRNFTLAFDVLNSIPSLFDKESKLNYNTDTGRLTYEFYDTEYTYEQYIRRAVSVLKAESDVLLSKSDTEAESLFLEHLSDLDLGVNTVNIRQCADYSEANKENKRYQKAVTIYNDYLVSVVRKALIMNKPELAKRISLLIRAGLSSTRVPGSERPKNIVYLEDDGFDYLWSYDTEAKDEAKEIIKSFNES
ncbi:MAG: hypothetical protein K2K98_10655 [Muribaculaceae bacterium]|nr:hypothetical protein [Muribaculaceae bacterium]